MTDSYPFSHLPHNQAAENNKAPIFEALKSLDLHSTKVLEIGSGTGQHGVYFCQKSPNLQWQLSEHANNMSALDAWYQVANQLKIDNLIQPIAFEIGKDALANSELTVLSNRDHEYIYSANVLHIISPQLAKTLVEDSSKYLKAGQKFVCYGPFKKDGTYTTDSNADFDAWLKSQGYGGMHDMKDIELWSESKLHLTECLPMPANNFLLVFEKR